MCDYSLMEFPNRLARQGENIVLSRFPSGAKGFIAATVAPKVRKRTFRNLGGLIAEAKLKAEPLCVTCLPEGARLRLENISPQFQSRFNVGAKEQVKVIQLSGDANAYRDAVEFRNGRQVSLQELPDGLQALVLSMGGEEFPVEISAEIDYGNVLGKVGVATYRGGRGTGRQTRFLAGLE